MPPTPKKLRTTAITASANTSPTITTPQVSTSSQHQYATPQVLQLDLASLHAHTRALPYPRSLTSDIHPSTVFSTFPTSTLTQEPPLHAFSQASNHHVTLTEPTCSVPQPPPFPDLHSVSYTPAAFQLNQLLLCLLRIFFPSPKLPLPATSSYTPAWTHGGIPAPHTLNDASCYFKPNYRLQHLFPGSTDVTAQSVILPLLRFQTSTVITNRNSRLF